MDMKLVGTQIAALRKGKGLTQAELSDRLGLSFQAVSKWERGETLPDTAILPELAEILETSVDFILSGGRPALSYRGKCSAEDAREGILCLKRMGELLGKENLLYRCAVEGINEKMNTSIEDAFTDEAVFECFVAEAIIQNLALGKFVDITEVRNSFQNDRFRDIVLGYCAKYGMK